MNIKTASKRRSDTMNILVAALIIGMAAAAIPPIVRAAPVVQIWMLRGIKPWACDLCMSFWSTVLATLFCGVFESFPLFAGVPAFVVTFAIVRHNSEPKGPPPDALPLEDSEE
jgi:hypothetical protein